MSDHGGNNVVYVAGEEEDAGDDLPQLFFSFFLAFSQDRPS